MAVRFLGALAWIFMFISAFVFLISYAGFPEEVMVYLNELGEPPFYLSKNLMFYLTAAFAIAFNVALMVLNSILAKQNSNTELTQAGVSISQIFFNLFFSTSIYFINILNSRENFDYSNFGYQIYVTGFLLAASVVFVVYARLVLKK